MEFRFKEKHPVGTNFYLAGLKKSRKMTIKKEDKGFRVWARKYDIYGRVLKRNGQMLESNYFAKGTIWRPYRLLKVSYPDLT